jgi:hypothetical protein
MPAVPKAQLESAQKLYQSSFPDIAPSSDNNFSAPPHVALIRIKLVETINISLILFCSYYYLSKPLTKGQRRGQQATLAAISRRPEPASSYGGFAPTERSAISRMTNQARNA